MKTKTNMEVMICTSSTRRWRGAPLGTDDTETRHIWTSLAEDAVAINHSRFIFVRAPLKAPFVAPDSSDQEIKICHNSSAGSMQRRIPRGRKAKKKEGRRSMALRRVGRDHPEQSSSFT